MVNAEDGYYGKNYQRANLGNGYVVYNGGWVIHAPSAQITIGQARFNGNILIYGDVSITGDVKIVGNVHITGDIINDGSLRRTGDTTLTGSLTTSGGTVQLN